MKKFDNYQKNLAVLSTAGAQDLSNVFVIGAAAPAIKMPEAEN